MSNDSVNYKIPDQIPMGISSVIDKNTFAITVRKIDEVNKKTTTSEFHKYSVGDYVGITGPLGNHFRITGDRILIIGGGTGIAPLRFLAKTINAANRNEKNKDIKNTHRKNTKIFTIIGAKNKEGILFSDEMKKYSDEILTTTDDGSCGIKGFACDPLEDICLPNRIDQIFCCGPEPMMKRVLDYSVRNNIPAQFSLERHMYCGVGVCGFCAIDGLRVCKDGPVFTTEQLKNSRFFGKKYREPDGVLRDI